MATDIVAQFIEENRRRNSEYSAWTEFIVADANDLRFPPHSFDFVFANWLLMYLNDDQLEAFAQRLFEWIAPGGHLFFRESCETR